VYKRYRLIVPFRVEAVQVTGTSYAWAATWCRGTQDVRMAPESGRFLYVVSVPTVHGIKFANVGDYIVKSPSGDFSVLGAKEFESKYELERDE
jgi:hypothetical protein